MSRNITPFGLRMPGELKSKVEEAAASNGRSINAEVVHILQSHFDRLGLGISEFEERRRHISDLAEINHVDELKIAMLRVLRLEESTILRERVARLGGPDVVLTTKRADLIKGIDTPAVKRSPDENRSYFSQVVGTWPLTALLTSEEIDKLASRVAEVTEAQKTQESNARKSTKEPK